MHKTKFFEREHFWFQIFEQFCVKFPKISISILFFIYKSEIVLQGLFFIFLISNSLTCLIIS